jgi:hypothetical protein
LDLFYTVGVIRKGFSSAALLMVAIGTAILFYFDPDTYGFYPGCFFRAMTGLQCPGCGLLRAIHHLSHGNLVAAAELNLLFVLSLPVLAWFTLRYWLPAKPIPVTMRSAWLWIFCGVGLTFTVARNLPGFEWLSR